MKLLLLAIAFSLSNQALAINDTSKKEQPQTKEQKKSHSELSKHSESNNGEMTFWFDSIPLPKLFELIAEFAEKDLKIEQSITQHVSVRYEKKTHWKKIVNQLAKQHQLNISITEKTIYVKK
ncbi:hypothetical protein [Aliikangiella sp. IMCC44359]|uniref:hypothetical protein n=1 Tax=Aliikangiella sp. IMCC44359 TaxID=3459125 RepID=UPI00403AC6D6